MWLGTVLVVVVVFGFTIFHDLFIADIWWNVGPMLGAGAVCGFSVVWSYRRTVAEHSTVAWIRYTGLYAAKMIVLGVVSIGKRTSRALGTPTSLRSTTAVLGIIGSPTVAFTDRDDQVMVPLRTARRTVCVNGGDLTRLVRRRRTVQAHEDSRRAVASWAR